MRTFFLLSTLGVVFYFFYQGNGNTVTLSAPSPDNRKVWQEPTQKSLSGLKSLPFRNGKVRLLAEYDITARVILKKYYSDGKNGRIAPLDLAVGWKKMSDPNVYGSMQNTQSRRFYNYRWSHSPPIPPNEIVTSSSNMHIIAANKEIEKQLKNIKAGQIVTLKGYLVHYREEYSNGGYWEWKSSLSRKDNGQGACELMYVEHVIIY